MIRIGTSGFSFDDWKGIVYPQELKKADWLEFFERHLGFTALEVNFTYYSLPSQKSLAGMSSKTSADFQFVVKAHRDMTHHLRDNSSGRLLDTAEVFNKFIFSLQPLVQDKKLSCVLMQFPYWFSPTPDTLDYLKKSRDLLGTINLVIEFRNSRWVKEATFRFLRDNGMGYCAVDEPGLKGLMPFAPECTSEIGYIRLHGRNRDWFNAPVAVRYNYDYSDEELKGFLDPVKKMESQTKKMFVFFNNCHAGHAAKNAVHFARMLLAEP